MTIVRLPMREPANASRAQAGRKHTPKGRRSCAVSPIGSAQRLDRGHRHTYGAQKKEPPSAAAQVGSRHEGTRHSGGKVSRGRRDLLALVLNSLYHLHRVEPRFGAWLTPNRGRRGTAAKGAPSTVRPRGH